MRSEDFFQIWNCIDENFIDSAGEDLERFRGSKNEKFISEKTYRKSVWKKAAAAAVCTAAVMLGVFAVLLNIGKIRLETGSGVSLDANSSGARSPGNDEYGLNLNENISGQISVNAAYGYEENSEKIKRYEIGEKFGENAEITSAKSTFLVVDGNPVLLKQEITVSVDYMAAYSTTITENCLNELCLPSFGSGFKTNPLFGKPADTNDNSDNDYLMQITAINIIVDYSDKTITPYTRSTSIIDGGH